jgi:hypothetical protein
MGLSTRVPRRSAPANDELLSRYLGALRRHGDPEIERRSLAEGHDVRTCPNCGRHVIFRIDPEGGWAECTSCGRAA